MQLAKVVLFNTVVFLLHAGLSAQVSYNGGFDYVGYDDKPEKWFMPATTSYEVAVDSAYPHSGRYSARIKHTTQAVNASGCVYYQEVDLSSFASYKKITVKYFFRINKGWNTYVKYFIQPVNPARVKVIDTSFARTVGPYTKGAWYEYEATAWVTPAAMQTKAVRIGLIAQSFIDMNVDDVAIYVDDKLLRDIPVIHPPRKLPDSLDIEWLNSRIKSLQVTDSYSNMNDLSFLKKTIGKAQIVALGESTHGTKEFNLLRARIINYLVDNMGFEVVAFENGITEMNIANELLRDKRLAVREIVDSVFVRVHQTEEITGLVDLLRKKENIIIAGFDDQKIIYPLQQLKKKLKLLDVSLYDATIALEAYMFPYRGTVQQLDSLHDHALRLLNRFMTVKTDLSGKTGPQEMVWLEKNLYSLRNSIYLAYLYAVNEATKSTAPYIPFNYRDSLMADNVLWLREFYKNKKIILWCHNSHIQKKSNGSYDGKHIYQGEYLLKTELGSSYKSFAFLTASGEATSYKLYNQVGEPVKLQQPYRICYEYYLGQAKDPLFYWELPAGRKNNQQYTALTNGLEWRSLGSLITPGADQFNPADLSNNFNGVFFIRNTTPASYFHLKRPQ